MKTAVEWLIEKIAEDYPEIPRAYREEYQKAKAMEKKQIENTFADGFVEGVETQKSGKQLLFPEQYYNETYNQNE